MIGDTQFNHKFDKSAMRTAVTLHLLYQQKVERWVCFTQTDVAAFAVKRFEEPLLILDPR